MPAFARIRLHSVTTLDLVWPDTSCVVKKFASARICFDSSYSRGYVAARFLEHLSEQLGAIFNLCSNDNLIFLLTFVFFSSC